MNFKNNVLLLFILLTISIFAQKDFTLKQVILEAPSLSPEQLNQLQWIPDTEDFSYVEESVDGIDLVAESIEPGNKKILAKKTSHTRAILVHLMGNHGSYVSRYPIERFEKYNNSLNKENFGSTAYLNTIINVYDNSVLYND